MLSGKKQAPADRAFIYNKALFSVRKMTASEIKSGLVKKSNSEKSASSEQLTVHPNNAITSMSSSKEKETSSVPQYQSCDRCRSKKIKCTYEKSSLNQCSNCKTASLECRNNDKLLRRSSPRGYTELLEETCRNLEIEVKRLRSMYEGSSEATTRDHKPNTGATGDFKVAVKSEGIGTEYALSDAKEPAMLPLRDHVETPSLDVKEPPALTASKIIQNHQKSKGQYQNIPLLVSLACPRSTMEVLFSTQLMAKIGSIFGFLSRECLYTSKLLSSLKDDFEQLDEKNEITGDKKVGRLLSENFDLSDVNDFIELFEFFFTIDNSLLTFSQLHDLIQIYFDNWSTVVPIFLKLEFLKTFEKFKNDYLSYKQNGTEYSADDDETPTPMNYKLFMCKLLVIVQMGLSSLSKPSHKIHHLIKLLIKNPFFHAKNTSISSLQFLTLSLHLFASTSPQEQICYHLRSLNSMMVQQLRLQRCPQSIVNSHGQQSNSLHRRTRRLLFWSNYILDCMVSTQLGVPRLIKDEDSEVLLPFDEPALEGIDALVEPIGLQILKIGVILGGILDGLFKNFNKIEKSSQLLTQEKLLETWHKNLPQHLKVEINPDGNINLELLEHELLETKNFGKLNMFLVYFFCKSLIHLILVSIGNEFGMEFSQSEESYDVGGGIIHPSKIDSYIKLHQYSEIMLQLLSMSYNLGYKITLPVFIPNLIVKFSLLGLERTLEYKKSCELFLQFRKLIEKLIDQQIAFKKLDAHNSHGAIGSLSWYSIKLFDITLSLLLLVNTKESKESEEYFRKRVNKKILKLIKKKANFYQELIKAEVGIENLEKYNGGDDKLENTSFEKETKYSAGNNEKPTNLLTSIDKLTEKPLMTHGKDDDEDDDNGIEFKPVPMAHRLSRDSTTGNNQSSFVKKESSTELEEKELEKYSLQWDGNVNSLTNVFKKDPILSFGDLKQFFSNSQVGIDSILRQHGNVQQRFVNRNISSENLKSKLSPNRDLSNTISNMAQGYAVKDLQPSSYPNSSKTLSDKEDQSSQHAHETKSIFSNIQHAPYINSNNQKRGDEILKSKITSMKSPSEALLAKLSNDSTISAQPSHTFENFVVPKIDWTEGNKDIIPSMSVNDFKGVAGGRQYSNKMSASKLNLLDFGFDNIDTDFLLHNKNKDNGRGQAGSTLQDLGNTENNNSFLFDGSMGLAQFLDLTYLNNKKRKGDDELDNSNSSSKKAKN